MKINRSGVNMIWFVIVLVVLAIVGLWSVWDEKSYALVDRFEQVDIGNYRGHQPETLAEYQKLKDLGIKTIINLREEWVAKEEEPIAKQFGFDWHNIPMSGFFIPNKVAVAKGLAIMDDPACQPVFTHCTYGKDRTGMMIGLHRIARGWSKASAWAEMLTMGFNPINIGVFLFFWLH